MNAPDDTVTIGSMREVPVAYVRSLRDTLGHFGCDTETAMQGLAMARVDLSRTGERVDWNDVAVFINRCARHLSPRQYEDLGELFAQRDVPLQLATRIIQSPRLLFHLMASVTQSVISNMLIGARDLPDGRVYLHFELPDVYVPCPPLFRALVGEYRTITGAYGLEDARLESDVGPWHCYMWLRPPQPRPANALRRVAGRLLDEIGRDLAQVMRWYFSQDVPGGGLDVSRLQRELGLSPAEAHVALRLFDGKDLDAIAAELGLSTDEVGIHVQRVRAKTSGRPAGSALN